MIYQAAAGIVEQASCVPRGGFGASYAPYPSVVNLQVRKDWQGSDKEFQFMQITIRTLGNKKSRSLFGGVWPLVALLPAASLLFMGCRNPNAAAPPPPAEVEVATVVQKDVPIYGEGVATLDGYGNAQIQPQVTGYIICQKYKQDCVVR